MIKKSLFFAGLLLSATSVSAMSLNMYARVMEIVDARDLTTLQQAVANGVNLNSPQPNGMTPLCETVMTGDYQGYEMLLSQGASPYVPCMRQLPQDQVADFYANQPKPHTYYTGEMMGAHSTKVHGTGFEFPFPTLGVGEVLIGGIAAAGILTFGHGGSGGGGVSPVNHYNWDAPLELKPEDFSSTNQYQASHIYSSDIPTDGSVNFLGAINAADAYARGYTGYKVKREANGTLKGKGTEAISTDKVAVAVVDDGVWIEHPRLADNILMESGKTYNFAYGACSGDSSSGKCWKKITTTPSDLGSKIEVELYENGKASGRKMKLYEVEWLVYKERYGTTYDPSDPTPIGPYNLWEAENYAPGNTGGIFDSYYDEENDKKYAFYKTTANGVTTLHLLPINCDAGECTYDDPDKGKIKFKENSEYDNHGTHVAGLVAAKSDGDAGTSGMMGVAYDANIIPIKFDETMQEGLNVITDAINLGANIVNFSSASTIARTETKEKLIQDFDNAMAARPDYLKAYQTAAKNNTILVFAAGNFRGSNGPYDSSVFSMAPLSSQLNGTKRAADGNTYNLTNLFVNVVALDPNNKLASYSAKCGVTKNYCVAAPGGNASNIFSTIYDGSEYTYGGMYGTSMATPIVSGALAVIKGAFPHLTNQQVVQILFETATDLGDPGVDDIYGHGLVNLEAATSPIGLPKIVLTTNTNGASVTAASSTASVPSSLSGVASALPAHMIVLDKYQRAFQVPTSSFVHVAKRENKLEGRFKSFMSGDEKLVANTDVFQMAYSERHSKLASQMEQGSVRFDFKPTTKWSFRTFYTENTETSGGSYFERLMLSPYGKMKEAWGGAVSYDLTKNWKATVLGQIGKNGFVDEDELRHMDHNKSSLFQSTLQYNGLKRVGLKVSAGMANEQGSVLGMWGKGAFKFGNSHTNFVGAGVTLNVTDAITLEGMYYRGTTKVNNSGTLMKMSNVKSDSFALTAAWQVNDVRTLGLQFVSPLRVKKGIANVDLPVARDAYQDVVYREAVQANLKPSAREYDVGFYYTDEFKENMRFQSELGVRLNPDHVAGAAPDWRALVGLKLGL